MFLLEVDRPFPDELELDEPRAGVDVIVANPVVVSATLRDVDVMDETAPLACVVTITVTIDLVDVETWADVIVVFDVLEVEVSDDAAPELAFEVSTDGTPVEVVAEVTVVGTTAVVGVPLEVVAMEVSVVRVVTDVEVMVAVGVVVDAVTTEVVTALDGVVEAEAPVPTAWRLWNMPSRRGISAAFDCEKRERTTKTPRVERSILLVFRTRSRNGIKMSCRSRVPGIG